jgi:hypothetical protein
MVIVFELFCLIMNMFKNFNYIGLNSCIHLVTIFSDDQMHQQFRMLV